MGKKRNLGKEGGSSEIKEINEKKGGDRETSRGRGVSSRRGRGISRGREGKKKKKKELCLHHSDILPGWLTQLFSSLLLILVEVYLTIVILFLYYLQVAQKKMGLRLHLGREGGIVAVGGGVEVSGAENTFTVGIYGRFYEYIIFCVLIYSKKYYLFKIKVYYCV